uniref:Ig-like domain-containing protein n=1 Tax=Chrysemys picta bellii TaxID=8478 RepID=A0A8C3HUE9_CHRPI
MTPPWLGLALTACLLCADPSLPRPSISLSPTGVIAPGADVTIRCQGQHRYVRFFLHKAGDLNPQRHMDPAGDGAEFRIPTVGRQHGGSYSCSYRLRSEPFVSSQPSDPVQLVVAGERPSSTFSLPARPSWGLSQETLRASGLASLSPAHLSLPCIQVGSGCSPSPAPTPLLPSWASDITSPKPRLCSLCSIQVHQVTWASSPASVLWPLWLEPAGQVTGVLSSHPSRVVALGESVTIRCEGRYPGMEFFLRKAGHPNPQVQTVPDGTVAEFPIASVSREDGGSYTCDYRSITDQSRSSYLSDPVEIIVAGEGPGSVARLPGPHPAGHSGGLCIDGTTQELGSRGSVSVGLGAQLAGPGFWLRKTLGSGREFLSGGPWICPCLGPAGESQKIRVGRELRRYLLNPPAQSRTNPN